MNDKSEAKTQRRVESTVTETRVKMTLTVDISGTHLTRDFADSWAKSGETTADPNHQYRQVEIAFRELCQTWGLQEAVGMIVSTHETRLTRKVIETEISSTSRELDQVRYDLAAEERARKEYDR